jgi:enamine deaminase RidA (YjgF/YER057c/UK114 family)
MNARDVTFFNPPALHPPLGRYSHGAVVPPGMRTVYVAGQVGVRADGSVPETFAEQADQIFLNIAAILAVQGMTLANIVKLTSYFLAGQDGNQIRSVRAKHLGDLMPAATAIYVKHLGSPDHLIEVEAIAVAP